MFQLFSTLGCHLCEDAKAIIDPIVKAHQLSYTELEISEKDEWIDAYGVRIPVLKSDASSEELAWPFDHKECKLWILSNL